MSDSDDKNRSQTRKPVVRVQRRRRSQPAGSQDRERAEAPRRDRRTETGQRAPAPTGQTGSRSTGTPWRTAPAGRPMPAIGGRNLYLLLGLLALAFVCICVVVFISSGGGDGSGLGIAFPTSPPVVYESTESDVPVATARPFVPPTRSATGQDWLVMLYQDADDKILEKDIYLDLNEAERVGSSDRVHIVTQIDRFAGGYEGDGNWTGTRRYYVTQDQDLGRVGSELVADLGEAYMSDGDTLVDFVTWATETFPADKHVLILSDHGLGWPGGWSDPAPPGRSDRSTPLSAAIGDQLFLNELDQALATIRQRTGVDKFEMIGLDACLMGHLEVASALAPHANYAVMSQETEPALGWAYTSFLQALQDDPDMTGAELGHLIVGSYVQDDQRIVDDQARADLLRQNSPMGSLFSYGGPTSAADVTRQMERGVTLSAIDLSAVPALLDSVNELSFALQGAPQNEVARARSYAQSFTSIFGTQVPPSYIDLGHFVQLLKQTRSGTEVSRAADDVLAALSAAVVSERHGDGKPGASGLSVYFPNSQLYRSPAAGAPSYTAIADRFASESLWDDLLAFHYTGRRFDASARQAVEPDPGAQVSGPGTGIVTVSPIEVSDTVAAPGRPVLLRSDVTGQNIGYALLFTGYYDRQSNSILIADMDYLESTNTREIGGVYYPVWPENGFTLEFEWEPLMFAISDGTDSAIALLTPSVYGATPEAAVYTVDGIYTYASGESRHARLYFRDGLLRQVFGFTGEDGVGAPREIHPETGDRFTVLEQWLDLDTQGRVVNQASEAGETLTFGEETFTWQELDAAPGAYVVGVLIKDLDGNQYEAYTTIEVE